MSGALLGFGRLLFYWRAHFYRVPQVVGSLPVLGFLYWNGALFSIGLLSWVGALIPGGFLDVNGAQCRLGFHPHSGSLIRIGFREVHGSLTPTGLNLLPRLADSSWGSRHLGLARRPTGSKGSLARFSLAEFCLIGARFISVVLSVLLARFRYTDCSVPLATRLRESHPGRLLAVRPLPVPCDRRASCRGTLPHTAR